MDRRKFLTGACLNMGSKMLCTISQQTYLNSFREDKECNKDKEEPIDKTCQHLSTDIPVRNKTVTFHFENTVIPLLCDCPVWYQVSERNNSISSDGRSPLSCGPKAMAPDVVI